MICRGFSTIVTRAPGPIPGGPYNRRLGKKGKSFDKMRPKRYLPFIIAAVSITVTLVLWQRLVSWERMSLQRDIAAITAAFKDDITDHVIFRVVALERMARRLEHVEHDGRLTKAEWEYDANLYIRDYESIESIEVVDADMRTRWGVPDGSKSTGAASSADPVKAEAFMKAKESRAPALSRLVELQSGEKGFYAYIPVFHNGFFGGCIAAAFKSKGIFDDVLLVMRHIDMEKYAAEVLDEKEILYSNFPGSLGSAEFTDELDLPLYGITWRVRMGLNPAHLSENRSILPWTALGLGFAWTFVLVSAVHFAQAARLGRKDLESVNLRLRHEILERREAEDRAVRSSRLYSVLSKVDEAIVRIREPETLFREACRICVEEGQFLMAWVGMKDPETRLIRPVSYWGVEEGYLENIRVSAAAELPEGRGPTGSAVREGRYFVCTDIEHDPNVAVWRESALKRGYRSSAAFPLFLGGRSVGALTLYASGPDFFDESLINLLNSLSADISFAMDSAEAEKKRKTAEEALKESEALLNKAQHIAHLGSWDWDIVNNTLAWSDEIYEIFGLEKDRFGATYEAFLNSVHPGDRKSVVNAVNDAVYKNKPYLINHRIVLPDGTIKTVQEQGDVSRNASGEAVRMIGAVQDITERKKMDDELREYRDHLEELVEARTAELKAVNRELEAFTYSASHDLQEPLRIVAGYMQLLARRYRGKLDKDADEFIEYAVDGAARMQRLISDLLSYSRVGRKVEFKEIDTAEAVRSAITNLKAAIEESGASVTYGHLPKIEANSQITNVFMNLIGNAIKYRGADHPKIRVDAERVSKSWQFSVADNGIGIEPRHHDRIFDLFQRLHGKAEYQGTGIGLSICKKIVESYGGRIWVESEPGKGSTFYFNIPDRKEVRHAKN